MAKKSLPKISQENKNLMQHIGQLVCSCINAKSKDSVMIASECSNALFISIARIVVTLFGGKIIYKEGGDKYIDAVDLPDDHVLLLSDDEIKKVKKFIASLPE